MNIQVILNQAFQFHQAGKIESAMGLYLKILPKQQKNADLMYLLGTAYKQIGELNKGVEYLKKSVAINPRNHAAQSNLGNTLKDLCRLDEALTTYDKAIALKPDYAEALYNRGITLYCLTRLEEALASYDQAIALKPDYVEALFNRGITLHDLNRLDEALASYDKAISLNPKLSEAYNNKGNTLKELKKLDEALASYDTAIALKPDYFEAFYNRGVTLKDLNRLDEALASYDTAIAFKPDYVEALFNRGVMLKDLNRLDEALASYDKAIALKPDYAEAYNNLGNALRDLKRLDEALASYNKAIALKPDYAEARSNLGVTLQDLGRLAEAEASYREAIRLKPDYAEAYWNLSFNLLLGSNLKEGFKLYEWRWNGAKEFKGYKRKFPQPIWLGGNSLEGKTILVHSEQGLGDTIQFCRYLKNVHELGAKVLFEVQPQLVPLLAGLAGVDELIGKGRALKGFDMYCPLMSLPLAFETNLDSIPATIPYLSVQPERLEKWSSRLGVTGFKVAICWKGTQKERSIPIKYFSSIAKIPKVRLISLQKGEGEKDLENLPDGMAVETLGAEFDSQGAFLDTAAVMKCCDLIITNDTSIAHLAGALGLPTWVALMFVPDWRWMMGRKDSPWYPSLQLFRQESIGNWQGVLDRMASILIEKLGESR